MKTIIHVNQHKIKSNVKNSKREPVLTVKTYKSNQYAHQAIIYGQDGLPAATVVYSADKPLSCGAHVWIETNNEVRPLIASKGKLPNGDTVDYLQ
jgi:hypothetical protein